ncbi:kinase-like domain-containing protein [Glomus cerebriforme]|uniref:Kinase-like domain-containing protein n=1 Tax=Glomus cerebriforme TaxID=658196 RepID=A0A397T7X2_9GLOM|nr:kinase-like domain-containing protein [Glomus cerebriforme]
MIITKYYKAGDLTHFITKDFFNINWENKSKILHRISDGLCNIHGVNNIHKDYHSGNIFIVGSADSKAITGDLGLNKSATESLKNDNEIYGIIPYVAPEIFQGQKYTKASDIYSFGMIMWELMTGRRPFWDKSHDTDLIIEIRDGLRPPIVTNAPEGYIELMQNCWHFDPNKRPKANDLRSIVLDIWLREKYNRTPTKIIKSPNIGPITTNNPNAIYKSRPLSAIIKSAESTRSLRQPILVKRKFNNDLVENNNEDKIIKKFKLCEDKNDGDYSLTKELGFDNNELLINNNSK